MAAVAGVRRRLSDRSDALRTLSLIESDIVLDEAEAMLGGLVRRMWASGWQPAELLRQVRREATAASVAIATTAVAIDHVVRPEESLDPRWAAQVASLALPTVPAGPGWLRDVADVTRLDHPGCIAAAVDVVSAILATAPLQILIPPPGSAAECPPRPRVIRDRIADPMLIKVRALLAQAESTTFPAEAETFTAKAQELMARHSIDAALVWEQLAVVGRSCDDPDRDRRSVLEREDHPPRRRRGMRSGAARSPTRPTGWSRSSGSVRT